MRRRRSCPTTCSRVSPKRSPTAGSSGLPVQGLLPGRRATIEGRVSQVEDITQRRRTVRWIVVGDDSGEVRVAFRNGYGADISPGQLLRITGKARQKRNRPMLIVDPTYHVVAEAEESA